MRWTIHTRSLELIQGDITEQAVDAIVNAANPLLVDGFGVNGAIQKRGGPRIIEETSRRYPQGCPTGQAVITGSGDLPCKHVIHAVGPIWRGGNQLEPQQLAAAYQATFDLARQHNCKTVALPALSTGVYGYPMDLASRLALHTAMEYLRTHPLPELIRFVLWGEHAFGAFAEALEELSHTAEKA